MGKINSRVAREKATVGLMIVLYCRAVHKSEELCSDCRALLDYAHYHLDNCRFGENKPVCRRCRIHCYQPEMRLRIKKVMRYAGTRLLFRHPVLAVSHFLDALKRPLTIE